MTGVRAMDQRYYASTYGRFNSPDSAGAHAGDPVSWNRYSYTGGDPVNRLDPGGTDWIYSSSLGWCSTLDLDGWCFSNGGGGGCSGISPDAMLSLFLSGDADECDPGGGTSYSSTVYDQPPQQQGGQLAGGGGGVNPPPSPIPTCSLEVESFPLNTLGGGPDLHGSLYFTSTQFGGLDDVIEGYTDDSNLLKAAVAPGNVGPVGNVAGTGTPDGVVSGPQVCSALGVLEGDSSKINGAGITYNALGPNSSSALRYMLQSLNSLLGSSWFNIPGTMLLTGYNTLLPGLESPRRRRPIRLK